MNTNAIDANKSLNQAIQTKGVTQNADVKVEPEAADKVQPVVQKLDSIELGTATSQDIGTYTVDRKKINEIKQDFARNTESFKKMVETMIEKQGKKVSQVLKDLAEGKDVQITVDSETQAAAQEAISEDGYFGVNKTSERIIDFAKALSGGDKSKIETLRNAFKEGFESAKEAFGGELPEISQQTYDKVMQGFDDWAKEE
ncbi:MULTISPECIES: hypothetical protein [Acetobacterium]|jgi:hypothetical protein|uniref:hypothetical protein n=1 Tax=Acetobacterium TaxID=33951 RepID=UPI000B9CA1FF|nr:MULTISPECIES: hypothetical protein [Acetobacterium]MEA4806951.1 hypothetical protein [Acetobacterium wieringae]OXS25055.1 MAG: hypothetical protein BI182_16425 [Acetobacterium sp. MES1]